MTESRFDVAVCYTDRTQGEDGMKQDEADRLIAIPKNFVNKEIDLPLAGEFRDLEAKSEDEKHKFFVHLNRKGVIELSRCTYQMSYVTREILVRVDLDADKTHRNPSFEGRKNIIIKGPHVHVFREGYGDKIAYPINEIFPDLDPQNYEEAFIAFRHYCNICKSPLQRSLNI